MSTLRGQLTLRLVAVAALLLGAAGVALHWQVRRALLAEFDAGLRATLESLAALTEEEPGGKIILDIALANAPQFESEHGAEAFLLRAGDGRELQRSRSLGGAALLPAAGEMGRPEFFEATLADGRALRFAGVRFFPGIEDEPRLSAVQVSLAAGRDRAPMDRSLSLLRTALFLTGAVALAALAAAVAWGVNAGLAPVRRLRDEVRAVEASRLDVRVAAGALPEELRPVASGINDLLARLESAFARERRFTATAAHELRTPLAELRSLAEVNLRTPASDAERTESWRDALASTQRMQRLAEQLLALTRAEDSRAAVEKSPVNFGAALEAAWQPHAALAASRGMVIESAVPPTISVQSDPTLLGIVLGNLCGNAAEHAPRGSHFRIAATAENGAVNLTFRNPAGALTAEDVAHLFERFWRKDEARADSQHHGLGLALAHEFAALLGGSLTARFAPAAARLASVEKCEIREAENSSAQEIEFNLRLPC